jgi:catechol 2,3-dioxygenase-like lactoylglutathione lyase family enzyme
MYEELSQEDDNENLIRIPSNCHFDAPSCDVIIESQKSKKQEYKMQTVNKLMMLSIVVSDMPKAKEFYVDKLGSKVTIDYRQDDGHWYVSLAFPDGGAAITLTTFQENIKPGTMSLYFETSDVVAAHKELSDKGVEVNTVQDDLFGPGSGVKFFNFEDPDGNQLLLVQAHESRKPF